MRPIRKTAQLAASAAALILAGSFAGAALAHPEHDGKPVKEVIVISEHDGQGADDAKGKRVHRFHIERDAAGDGEGERRVIRIERDGKGKGEGAHAVRIERGGPGEHRLRTIMLDGKRLADCEGGEKLVDESAGDDKEKTKVIICGEGGDPAARRQRLEQALARINANEHISTEHKEKIAASLRAAIERAESAR